MRFAAELLILTITSGFALTAAEEPAGLAASLAAEMRHASLDPSTCRRVRDINLAREDLRFYFTDGYLILGKPVCGRRIFAVFATMDGTDDAELIVRPPNHAERLSLASFTGSPNLNEHFKTSVLIFTDGTAEQLEAAIAEGPRPKQSEDRGLLLAGRWDSVVRNLIASFEVRLMEDLLKNEPASRGFFYSAIDGNRNGNFDMMFDPTANEPVVVGQLTSHNGKTAFDIWASFLSRSRRMGAPQPQDEARLSNYRIDSTIDSDLTLTATTRVTVTPRQRVTGALSFEISPQMEVLGAAVDGAPVETYRRESMRDALIRGTTNEPLLAVLPHALEAGRDYEFEFRHRGRVIRAAGNNVFFVESRMTWYPQHGLQFTTFDLTFRYPKALDLVASGRVVEEKTEGDSKITRRRTTTPTRVAGFNLGEYARATAGKGIYQVEVYGNRATENDLQRRREPSLIVLPGSPTGARPPAMVALPPTAPSSTTRLASLASEISSELEWMASQFGPPPMSLLTVSPIPGYFGQGFPGLLYLSTVSFLNDRDRPAIVQGDRERVFFNEIIHAHETAHQWWGNLVTCDTYHDEWLMEALANYTALLVLEKKKGARALDEVLQEYRANLLAKGDDKQPLDSAGPIFWGVRLQSSRGMEVWRIITYEKGSWVLHMLRRRMGDEQFLAMLGELRRKYEYQTVTTEQFRQLARAFGPKDHPDPSLDAFFDSWIYSTGIPALELKTSVKGKAPAVSLSLTLKQSDVSADFSADVPVEIRLSATKSIVKWIRTSSEPVNITIPLRAAPAKVELAPGNAILSTRK